MREDGNGVCVPAEEFLLFTEGWVDTTGNKVGD